MCADNNGLFVSLDRISKRPFLASTLKPTGCEQPRVGNSNPYNLGVGSTVQLMSISPNEPPRYGVIRWIGPMSGVEGTIAGVEMVKCYHHYLLLYV